MTARTHCWRCRLNSAAPPSVRNFQRSSHSALTVYRTLYSVRLHHGTVSQTGRTKMQQCIWVRFWFYNILYSCCNNIRSCKAQQKPKLERTLQASVNLCTLIHSVQFKTWVGWLWWCPACLGFLEASARSGRKAGPGRPCRPGGPPPASRPTAAGGCLPEPPPAVTFASRSCRISSLCRAAAVAQTSATSLK